MKREAILALLLILAAVMVSAQQAPPPDLSAGIVAQAAYKGWLESQNASIWQQITAQQALTASIPQDEANISTLQQQVAALQQQVAALQGPASPPPPKLQTLSLIDPANLPAGVLSGVVDGIGWNTNQWQATVTGVAAIAQGSRTFVLPAGATLVSLQVSCPAACQFTITDTVNGFSSNSPVLAPNSPIQLGVGWTKPSGPISFSMISGAAVNARLTQIQWQ